MVARDRASQSSTGVARDRARDMAAQSSTGQVKAAQGWHASSPASIPCTASACADAWEMGGNKRTNTTHTGSRWDRHGREGRRPGKAGMAGMAGRPGRIGKPGRVPRRRVSAQCASPHHSLWYKMSAMGDRCMSVLVQLVQGSWRARAGLVEGSWRARAGLVEGSWRARGGLVELIASSGHAGLLRVVAPLGEVSTA